MSLLWSIESEGVNHSTRSEDLEEGGGGRVSSPLITAPHIVLLVISLLASLNVGYVICKNPHTHTTQNHTKKAISCCNNSLRVTTFISNANTWETPQLLNWKGKVQKRNNSLFLNIVPSRWMFITHMLSSFWSFYLLETSAAWKKKFDYKL